MFLEKDVGVGQVFDIFAAITVIATRALKLLLQLAQPLPDVRQALVKQLRAVGVEQQPGLLLRGGLQHLPQLAEGGQAFSH